MKTPKNSTKSRSCKGKHRYESASAARSVIEVAERVRGAAPGRIVAYPCRFGCHGWHIGHVVNVRK